MTEIQQANDALALMGVKLTPMAEMYADLHEAYTELLAEHAALMRFHDELAEDLTEAMDILRQEFLEPAPIEMESDELLDRTIALLEKYDLS